MALSKYLEERHGATQKIYIEVFSSRAFLIEVAKANEYGEHILEPELPYSQIWNSNTPGQHLADIVLAHISQTVRHSLNQTLAIRTIVHWLTRAVPLSLITIASDALRMQDERMYGPRRQPKLGKHELCQDQDLEQSALVAAPPQQYEPSQPQPRSGGETNRIIYLLCVIICICIASKIWTSKF